MRAGGEVFTASKARLGEGLLFQKLWVGCALSVSLSPSQSSLTPPSRSSSSATLFPSWALPYETSTATTVVSSTPSSAFGSLMLNSCPSGSRLSRTPSII